MKTTSSLNLTFVLCCAIIFVFTGCTGSKTGGSFYSQEIQCYIIQEPVQRPIPEPKKAEQFPPELQERFSQNSLMIAHAVGITDMLKSLVELERLGSDNEALIQQLRISNRINIASMEIAATAAAIDCEEERADQIADFLETQERRKDNRLTAAAIGVGAVTAIVTGVILLSTPQSPLIDGMGIVGGVAEVILGVRLLRIQKNATYFHEINPLKSIIEGKNYDHFFPPSVWYYLNFYEKGLVNNLSVRENLLNIWINAGQIPSVEEARKLIYFGNGGVYSSQQLRNRANMLDQMEAQINIMQNDLKNLMLEVNSPLEDN